jgi:hypothetical protein
LDLNKGSSSNAGAAAAAVIYFFDYFLFAFRNVLRAN